MANNSEGSCEQLGLPNCDPTGTELGSVVGTIFLFVGFLATLFLVIAGIQYAASAGDPQKAAQAKNSIIYALIGVILSFSVFAIVNYLFGTGERLTI